MFIGYPPNNKGYRLLSLIDNSVIISRDVTFQEQIFPYNSSVFKASYLSPLPVSLPTGKCADWDYDMMLLSGAECATAGGHSQNINTKTTSTTETTSTSTPEPSEPLRKSTRLKKQPEWLQDYAANIAQSDMNHVVDQCVTLMLSHYIDCCS